MGYRSACSDPSAWLGKRITRKASGLFHELQTRHRSVSAGGASQGKGHLQSLQPGDYSWWPGQLWGCQLMSREAVPSLSSPPYSFLETALQLRWALLADWLRQLEKADSPILLFSVGNHLLISATSWAAQIQFRAFWMGFWWGLLSFTDPFRQVVYVMGLLSPAARPQMFSGKLGQFEE